MHFEIYNLFNKIINFLKNNSPKYLKLEWECLLPFYMIRKVNIILFNDTFK